jgi:hypothetical protein
MNLTIYIIKHETEQTRILACQGVALTPQEIDALSAAGWTISCAEIKSPVTLITDLRSHIQWMLAFPKKAKPIPAINCQGGQS